MDPRGHVPQAADNPFVPWEWPPGTPIEFPKEKRMSRFSRSPSGAPRRRRSGRRIDPAVLVSVVTVTIVAMILGRALWSLAGGLKRVTIPKPVLIAIGAVIILALLVLAARWIIQRRRRAQALALAPAATTTAAAAVPTTPEPRRGMHLSGYVVPAVVILLAGLAQAGAFAQYGVVSGWWWPALIVMMLVTFGLSTITAAMPRSPRARNLSGERLMGFVNFLIVVGVALVGAMFYKVLYPDWRSSAYLPPLAVGAPASADTTAKAAAERRDVTPVTPPTPSKAKEPATSPSDDCDDCPAEPAPDSTSAGGGGGGPPPPPPSPRPVSVDRRHSRPPPARCFDRCL